MVEVRQTAEFSDWLRRLKDAQATARIVARVRRMYVGRGSGFVILLCVGDKRTQRKDIKRARELAASL